MIAHTFQDPFSPEWIKTHVPNSTHDLMILRHILPWQSIIDRLTAFYDAQQGRNGQSLRTMVKPRQYRLCWFMHQYGEKQRFWLR